MKFENLLILGAAAIAGYFLFVKKDGAASSGFDYGSYDGGSITETSSALGGQGEAAAAFDAATAQMAASFRNAGINPGLMQAKYDEFLAYGVYAAAALKNVPTNEITRNNPTGDEGAIGTVGVISAKYTPNAIIPVSGGNYFTTDEVGNVVHDSSAIINETARAADVATAGMSGAAKVEASRQYELAAMGRHD